MARRWNLEEEEKYRSELIELYLTQNKSLKETSYILGLKENTVYNRLKRLGIQTHPENKIHFRNQRHVKIPDRSALLAEFIGVMLGDGHVSHFEAVVTLGTKEIPYVEYVKVLMEELFFIPAHIHIKKNGYRDVYIGSVDVTKWLLNQGLVTNKVAAQVDAPQWIFDDRAFMVAFIRGFFDTDGSIYKLRFGLQISLTNRALPLLNSLQHMLFKLGYTPSAVSAWRVYITKRSEVFRFFEEIQPANSKHCRRYEYFTSVGR